MIDHAEDLAREFEALADELRIQASMLRVGRDNLDTIPEVSLRIVASIRRFSVILREHLNRDGE